MEAYRIDPIFPHDRESLLAYDQLCRASGIRRDEGADLILAVRTQQGELAAAGSILGKSLRSLVTAPELRGEGVMARLVTALMEAQRSRGNDRIFIYSKAEYRELYESLGFTLIAEIPGRTVMMENSSSAFADYIVKLQEERDQTVRIRGWEERAARAREEGSGALVMNLNPMTLGHLELIRETAEHSALTDLFILDEDASFYRFSERKAIAEAATADIPGLILHGSGDYLISRASFPAYFMRDLTDAAEQQAELDARVFLRIARALKIGKRVLGDEPFLALGRRYNEILASFLEENGIRVVRKARFTDEDGIPYSASRVREALRTGDFEAARRMTPAAAHRFLDRDYLGERVTSLTPFVPEVER